MRSINALLAKLASRVGCIGLQVNKMDDPSIINADGTWSKERYDEIVSKLTPFLRSCGYNPKKDIIFLPMSGLLGQNIKDPVPASACPWYKVGALSTCTSTRNPLLLSPVRQTFGLARRLHALQDLPEPQQALSINISRVTLMPFPMQSLVLPVQYSALAMSTLAASCRGAPCSRCWTMWSRCRGTPWRPSA